MKKKHLRNQDLIPQNLLDKVSIVGLGGIGSAVVQLLSIMGFKALNGYDPDIMEEHNFGTTLYPESLYTEVGNNWKITMAKRLAIMYGKSTLEYTDFKMEHFTGEGQILYPKTFVCTDNMDSRKTAYESWKMLPEPEVFIDLRMDALTMSCVTVRMDADSYMEYWFPPGESGESAPCTMKHTIFCANMIAGIGVNQLFNILTGRPYYQYIWQGLSPYSTEHNKFTVIQDQTNPELNNNYTEEMSYGNSTPYNLN